MRFGPWIDEEEFNPNYLLRSLHLMPKAGDKPEWRQTQDYWVEKDIFPNIDLDDSAFAYDYSGADATARRRTGGVT